MYDNWMFLLATVIGLTAISASTAEKEYSIKAAPPLPTNAAMPIKQRLPRLLYKPPNMAQEPRMSMDCFGDYIAASNKIGEAYSKEYNDCQLKATKAREDMDQQLINERRTIESTSQDVCRRLGECNMKKNTLNMLNCHANAGANNTKLTYAMSGNASEQATVLKERYRLIDLRHDQCCHAAERVYVEQTASSYNYLQACLEGTVEPRPTAAATTSRSSPPATTTTTTTEWPAETTTAEKREEVATQRVDGQISQILNVLN